MKNLKSKEKKIRSVRNGTVTRIESLAKQQIALLEKVATLSKDSGNHGAIDPVLMDIASLNILIASAVGRLERIDDEIDHKIRRLQSRVD
jgi:hypothetical protein